MKIQACRLLICLVVASFLVAVSWVGPPEAEAAARPDHALPQSARMAVGAFSTITVVPKSGTGIGLSWARPAKAARFEITRSTSPDFKKNVRRFKTGRTWLIDDTLKARRPGAGGQSYYYRIKAYDPVSKTARYSSKIEANLKTSVPTGLKVTRTAVGGATLTWNYAWNGRQYAVRAATDPGFTRDVKTFVTTDGRNRLAINSLKSGQRYYFKVRSLNGNKQNIERSSYGAAVSATTRKTGTPLTAVSFNVLTLHHKDKNRAHDWLQRRPAVVSTITGSGADVVGVQEAYDGNDYPGGDGVTPQWESLRKALVPKGYNRALTGTDGVYNCMKDKGRKCRKDEYLVDGNHIFYRTSTLKPIGKGGKISLTNPDKRTSGYTAVWQVFEKRDSGVRFLAVNTHYYWRGVGQGGKYEADRTKQSKALAAGIRKVNTQKLPVVIMGDFNTGSSRGPVGAIVDAGYTDAAGVDVPRTRFNYNSYHGFKNPPPKKSTHIDHIFVSASVATKKWELLVKINASTGKFSGTVPSDHHAIMAVLTLPR